MSKVENYYCDRVDCGEEIEEQDCLNKFVGSASLKIRRAAGFHLCNFHVKEFKETYNLK